MFSLLIVRVCVCHLTYSDETELAMCLINCHHFFAPCCTYNQSYRLNTPDLLFYLKKRSKHTHRKKEKLPLRFDTQKKKKSLI